MLKEAETLAGAGYRTTVLSVKSHAPSVQYDEAIMQTAAFEYCQIDLLPGSGSYRSRLLSRLARELCAQGGIELPSSLGPTRALLAHARRFQPALTIAHVEPALWVATKLIKEGRTVAADFEDWHSEDLDPTQRRHRPCRLLRSIESTLLHHAAYVSTTSNILGETLHRELGGKNKPHTIYNAFPLQPRPKKPPRANVPLSIVWFSQTTGPNRGLEEFLQGWTHCSTPSRLTLLGTVNPAYKNRLLNLVPVDRRNQIRFKPLIPPHQLPGWLAEHDVGLALETRSIRNRDLTVTNKILQYLNAGLAVIATPTQGQREVLHQFPDVGEFIDLASPTAIGATIDRWSCRPRELEAMQLAARSAAEQVFSWEQQSKGFLTIVDAALAPRA